MKTLKDIRINFIKSLLVATNTKKAVKAICVAYIDTLKCFKIEGNGLSVATMRKEISLARKGLKDAAKTTKQLKITDWACNGCDSGFGFLVLDYDIIQESNQQRRDNLDIKQNEKLSIPASITPQFVAELLNSHRLPDVIIGLALAIGRRSSEILYSAKIKDIGGGFLNFSGQLKSKDAGNFTIPIAFNIPAKTILNALKSVRTATNYNSVEDAQKYSGALSREMSKKFKDSGLHFHDTRKIYAAWCLKMIFPSNTTITKTLNNGQEIIIKDAGDYITAILGHDDSMKAAKENYLTFDIDNAQF